MIFAHELGHVRCNHSKRGNSFFEILEQELEAWIFAQSVVPPRHFYEDEMWKFIGGYVIQLLKTKKAPWAYPGKLPNSE